MMRRMVTLARPLYKLWFRSEVRGLDTFPAGGALIVSNHSGGATCAGRPDLVGRLLREVRIRPSALHPRPRPSVPGADHEPSDADGHDPRHPRQRLKALRSGAVVIVFPGGDYDALRPTWQQNRIDFNGRTGYVTTAIEAGVPIVPAVSIGGQETQLFLTRGTWLAKRLGLKRLTRVEQVPLSIGFPFGLSVGANQPPASRQDRHPGLGADRHHRPVRGEPRRCRSRRACSQGHAGGVGPSWPHSVASRS